MKDKIIGCIVAALLLLLIGLSVFFKMTPSGKAMWNTWFHAVQEADDKTNYETKKKVEDSCRSMIASYEADKLTYEQYKDSENEEKQSWAEQAKMRANRTASSYNNFILENSYVWQDNVPSDIRTRLEYIE